MRGKHHQILSFSLLCFTFCWKCISLIYLSNKSLLRLFPFLWNNKKVVIGSRGKKKRQYGVIIWIFVVLFYFTRKTDLGSIILSTFHLILLHKITMISSIKCHKLQSERKGQKGGSHSFHVSFSVLYSKVSPPMPAPALHYWSRTVINSNLQYNYVKQKEKKKKLTLQKYKTSVKYGILNQ